MTGIQSITDFGKLREAAAGYETAILDVWYVLHHLDSSKLDEVDRNKLQSAEGRLRAVLESTGRFETEGK